MEANKPSDQKVLTKEEAISQIRALADELGHVPKKNELPDPLKNRIRPLFEKWCYALEASGLVVPSERVQEKRRKREAHKAAVAARAAKRAEKEKLRKQEMQKRRMQKKSEDSR